MEWFVTIVSFIAFGGILFAVYEAITHNKKIVH